LGPILEGPIRDMTHFSSFKKSHIFLLLKDLQAPPQSFQPSQQEQTLYGLKIGDADIDICCYCGSIPGATKAYRKVDFESFSMQMHVLFRLNLKVKSSVVLFSSPPF
jgi:hypothetical protein